jgi:hypothetical protein
VDQFLGGRSIVLRSHIYQQWKKVYWDDFIPLAHGIRLFGMVYNDAVRPADPYEFLNLLGASGMLSVRRNRLLMDIAARVKERPELLEEVRTGQVTDPGLQPAWHAFLRNFGDLACGNSTCTLEPEALAKLIREMAAKPIQAERFTSQDVESLQEQFISRLAGSKRAEMAEYLDLARASYRLRDDDNLHLGKIKAQFIQAVEEHQRRKGDRRELPAGVQALWAELEGKSRQGQAPPAWKGFSPPRARQMVGQPASPGLARGPARVVL